MRAIRGFMPLQSKVWIPGLRGIDLRCGPRIQHRIGCGLKEPGAEERGCAAVTGIHAAATVPEAMAQICVGLNKTVAGPLRERRVRRGPQLGLSWHRSKVHGDAP